MSDYNLTMFERRPAVSEVFTPRRTEVNKAIYVDRLELERELSRALRGSLHTVVFGESGSGKSWLYKKVLSDLGAFYATANCATALRLKSLQEEIKSLVTQNSPKRLVEYKEGMNAKAKIPIAEGGLASEKKYEFAEQDPVLDCFEMLREGAGKNPAVLVIDNLEFVFSSQEIMNELASLIALLDDQRYSKFDIKLLIVGVPSDVKTYLSKAYASIANRIAEISEVSSLSENEVHRLVEKGFVDLLRVKFEDDLLQEFQNHVAYVTMGFAQHVQEYCEQLGYVVEDDQWIAKPEHLQKADAQWLKQGLSQASGMIAPLMNEKETKVGRRNQVLYAIGVIAKKTFTATDIESVVRNEFPVSTVATTLAVGQILSELSGEENPIIKRSSKGFSYEFRDPRYAMALRVFLQKDPNREKVYRRV
jgi:hypothetical protein